MQGLPNFLVASQNIKIPPQEILPFSFYFLHISYKLFVLQENNPNFSSKITTSVCYKRIGLFLFFSPSQLPYTSTAREGKRKKNLGCKRTPALMGTPKHNGHWNSKRDRATCFSIRDPLPAPFHLQGKHHNQTPLLSEYKFL